MFTRICAAIAKVCLQLGVLGLVLIIACVSYQVFGRYVMNNTPTWAESLALLLVLYVTMLGCAVGVRDAGHIGLDSILAYAVAERHRIWFEYVIHVLVGVFGFLMAWHGGVLAASVMPYKIPILGLPEGINHIPLVIAGALIVLFSIEHILALIAGEKVVPSWH